MNARQDSAAADIPHVVAPPPLIYLLPLVGSLGAGIWHPRPILGGIWPWVLGPVLVLIGALLLRPAIAAFREARTNPKPWKPSTALVITGPYRFTRNPMYVGFTAIYLGITLWVNSLWPVPTLVLFVLPVMEFLVIRREERYLARKFGAPYEAYRRQVRRWI